MCDKMSVIQEFYKNSTILITGGSGFLGKLLVEKILRCCQNINKIYLIMRNKNGLNAWQRMDTYFEDQLFQRLKLENPMYKNKVIVIQGDVDLKKLNLSIEDEELLINNVNIIFHAAASINFTQPIRMAVETNLHGIRKVMDLANKMKHLKSFVHISTVYTNCHLKTVDENIHSQGLTYQNVMFLLDSYSDSQIKQMTSKLLGKAPNTYVFTKALSEKYISENCGNLPIGIFRPAIVVSTAKEPFSGWIDNFYGPTGLISSAVCGLLHVMHGSSDVFSNIVPADMVVNAIIATGWEIGLRCKKLPIYNYVSIQNPLTWGEYVNLSKIGLDYPFSNSFWYMSLIFTRKKWLYNVYVLILHLVPAYICDTVLKVLRKKPQTYARIHSFVKVLSYFGNREWEYKNTNVLELWSKMSEEDKLLFNFDISTLDWKEYFKHYIKGIRVYLFKDSLTNLEKARTRYKMLFWAHHILKYSFIMLSLYFFYTKIC